MLSKAHSRISKELDLQKFIHRQRVFITATLSLLNGNQKSYADKYSQLVIRESSDFNATSSDAELSDWRADEMRFIENMQNHEGQIDKRLFDIFRLRKEDQKQQR